MVQSKNNKPLINEQITFKEVLLIETDKEQRVVLREEAMKIAKDLSLDLICVSPNSSPPVCKLADFQKLIYQNKKKEKRKNEVEKKEFWISFNIGEHDLITKLERAYKLLEKNVIIKFILKVQAAEQKQKELALQKCQKIINYLIDKSPKIEIQKGIKKEIKNLSFVLFWNKKSSKGKIDGNEQ